MSTLRKELSDALGRGRLEYGRLTSELRGLPDFLIIGAQKGGTTSLYRYMVTHPDIRRAARKEVHYFDRNFEKGPQWYRAHFPTEISKRLHSRKTGKKLLCGEATPEYMLFREIPRRAKDLLPAIKIIVLLRDPIDRAFSHYTHMVARGLESRTFADAIQTELSNVDKDMASIASPCLTRRRNAPQPDTSSYLIRGHYADQLDQWSRYYDRDQIYMLKSDDLFESPETSLNSIFAFLEIGAHKVVNPEVYNRGQYKSRQMSGEMRECLHTYFEPHNERLQMDYNICFTRSFTYRSQI